MWEKYRLYFYCLLLVFLVMTNGVLTWEPGKLRSAAAVLLGVFMVESILRVASRKERGGERTVVMICLLGLIVFMGLLLIPV